jgi:hypothetical protein
MIELSTAHDQPAASIWSWVVADHGSCFRPGCETSAAEAELDHRIGWPEGATDTANVRPVCKLATRPGPALRRGLTWVTSPDHSAASGSAQGSAPFGGRRFTGTVVA